MSDVYTMGIDIGSTASKCVIMKNGEDIVSSAIVGLGAGTSGTEKVKAETLSKVDFKESDIAVDRKSVV